LKALLRWFWRWPWSAKMGLVAALVLVVFAFFNDSTTTIHLIFGQVDMPVYVALGLAGVLGGLAGVVLGHALARREFEERPDAGSSPGSAKDPATATAPGDGDATA